MRAYKWQFMVLGVNDFDRSTLNSPRSDKQFKIDSRHSTSNPF